mgnify:FL=1
MKNSQLTVIIDFIKLSLLGLSGNVYIKTIHIAPIFNRIKQSQMI